MDSEQQLHQTEIWKYLSTISEDYANRSSTFVKGITSILNTISDHFPYYTEHNATHSYNILNRMFGILKEDCFIKGTTISLSDIEIYLLICSSYAHDIGMAVFPGEEDLLLKQLNILKDEHWKTNECLQKYLRDHHSERGYNYLLQNFENLHVPENLLSYLGSLMKSHNKSTSALKLDTLEKNAAGSKPLNLTQLACILCVADALEFSDSRIKDGVLSQLKEKLQQDPDDSIILSYQENMKNACIGSNVTISDNGEIIVNGTFTDPDVLNLAHKTFDDIELWLTDYLEIDNYYTTNRLKIRSPQIYRSLDYAFGTFERLGIRMKKENIINLISSNSLWGNNNNSVVIKELLQNAVEACRYRKYNSSPANKYDPKITVEFNNKQKAIIINDNGCGMTKDVILNNFLTVGNSRSTENDYKRTDYYSIAKFGIGFWSVFTIANRAHIETTPFEGQNSGLSFDVSISGIKDFSVLTPIKQLPGTTITLFVKDDINLNDLFSIIHLHVICSEIPISIKNQETLLLISEETILPNKKELFGAKLPIAQKLQVDIFNWEEAGDEFSFKMFIVYVKTNGKISFLTTHEISPVHWLFGPRGGLHLCAICGFVTSIGTVYTIFQHNSVSGYIANAKSPKGFVFNINRRTLLPSQELTNFGEKLSTFLHEGFKAFLKKMNSLNDIDIYRLISEAKQGMQGGIGQDSKQIINAIERFPELYVYKLYKIEKGKTLNNCEVEYHNIDSLLKQNYSIISYQPFHSFHSMTRFDDRNPDLVYMILTEQNQFNGLYFHETKPHMSLLFDWDRNSYILNLKLRINNINQIVSFPITVINTSSIELGKDNIFKVGHIQGVSWTGEICFKKVIGNKFVFPPGRIIVDPKCLLAEDLLKLYEKGEYRQVCELINLLSLSESGHTDESIIKYQ